MHLYVFWVAGSGTAWRHTPDCQATHGFLPNSGTGVLVVNHTKIVVGIGRGAAILGNWPESHAPPSSTGLAARRQRKDSGSVWLRSTMMVLGTKSGQICKETGTSSVLIWRLTVAVRSLGESHSVNEVWQCLQLLVVLRRLAPSGVIYKAFGDASKVGLLSSLS
ncbi:hypothetical protein DEO72_LG4g152 [Vigna unguiculata]|uniref:Uncharacterized protein n=1 Tax=Vigna unguiculata TaxID=3917 RepID=A0A4D6LKG5_VIGUN|nr:hypothetical protein DEO72_LG4g152 [Vigna unguiculata]